MIREFGGSSTGDEVTEYVAETEIVGVCHGLGDHSRKRDARDADTGGHAACAEDHATSKHADAGVS